MDQDDLKFDAGLDGEDMDLFSQAEDFQMPDDEFFRSLGADSGFSGIPEDMFTADGNYSDSYQDFGEYRSFDGSREYHSFDAALPDADPDEWYYYSEADQELDTEDEEPRAETKKKKRRHPVLSGLAHALLVFLTVCSIAYLVAVYTDIPQVKRLRTIYIQTAMSTLSHKWLATAFFPSEIIDQVMLEKYQASASTVGIESDWGAVQVRELPNSGAAAPAAPASSAAPEQGGTPAAIQAAPDEGETEIDEIQEYFFSIFWELDRATVTSYMAVHPEALANGWFGIDINEAGLNDGGTSMQTIYGDQVLAIDARNGVVLIRVYLSSNQSRGVLAICKDTSRVSHCAASTLGSYGQYVGTITDNNGGILGLSASGFVDEDQVGNGGDLAGLAICSGVSYGERLGGLYKRLELRNDNKMYIRDSSSQVGSGTRDACEFTPALIIDGEVLLEDPDWDGINPRAALGQSERLETMMIVVEGRYTDSMGCSTWYVAEKLKEYGCVQAMNLDGGTSAMMYYKGEYLNRCANYKLPEGRTVPTAWVYKPYSG